MKKTGKALSLVLSLALVVSSLTMTFASAASTPSEDATVKLSTDKWYLSNGGADAPTQTSGDLKSALTTFSSEELSDHSNPGTLALKDVVITSGSDVATLIAPKTDGTVDSVKLKLANKDVQGTVTLAARYEGSVTRGTSADSTTVYATSNFTVTVLKAGMTVIGKGTDAGAAEAPTDPGKYPKPLDTLAKSTGDKIYGEIETVGPDTTADAKWTPVDAVVGTPAANAVNYVVKATGAITAASDLTATTNENGTKGFVISSDKGSNAFNALGSIAVNVQKYNNGVASAVDLDKASTTTSVTNTVKAPAGAAVISEFQGATYLSTAAVTTSTLASAATNVTGCDVDLTAATSAEMDGGNIGKLTGPSANVVLAIKDGTVGNVSVTNGVTVTKGSVGDIDSTASAVTVNGGTVGNIKSGAAITVESTDSTVPVSVGNITETAAGAVTINSNGKAAVKTGDITLGLDSAALTLSGDSVSVGTIDADYRTATLTLSDFKGAIAAPVNTYTQGISSTPKFMTVVVNQTTGKTDAVITGKPFIDTLTVTAGTLTFADGANIGTHGITGSGLLKFAPAALYTKGNVTGVKIQLTKDFNVGDTVFTSDTGKAYVGGFTPVGFTVEKVAASNTVDAFKVKTIVLSGIQINGSDKVALNTTEKYTADCYPTGTSLPAGDTIKWSFNGNSNYLTATFDGNTASVTAVKSDPTFASLNKGTLTAEVVDSLGFRDYAYADATFDVVIGDKPVPTLTTTVTDLDGNVINATSDTVVKIQQSTELRVHFNADKAGISDINYVTGNDKVAQTNTVSAWNGTSGVYTIYTNGAVGSKVGVYAAGHRVFQVEITDRPFKCDTSVDFSMKAGKTYTFKITPNAGTKIDNFTFLTGNDSKLSTWGCWKQADGTEMARVKAVSAGRYGVYAKINGVTYKVFAITVQ